MNTTLSILTFNLYFGKALEELTSLAQIKKPDIICVQEFPVNEAMVRQLEKAGYELADYSPSFFRNFRFYSVATFYNPQTIEHKNGQSITLARGFYELLLFFLRFSPEARTSLNNNFMFKANNRQFRICNLHLTALQSTNKVRVSQLKTTLAFLQQEEKDKPTVVVGDFNYVYKRKVLEELFQSNGYKEATNNLLFTIESRILGFFKIKMKPDYIWYKYLNKKQTTRLNRQLSDHYPVFTQFEF